MILGTVPLAARLTSYRITKKILRIVDYLMKSIFDAKFHSSVRRIRRFWRIGVRSVIGWYDDHIVNSDGLQTQPSFAAQLQAETLKPDQWVVMRWWFNRRVAACCTRNSARTPNDRWAWANTSMSRGMQRQLPLDLCVTN